MAVRLGLYWHTRQHSLLMPLTRRDFLKLTAATAIGTLLRPAIPASNARIAYESVNLHHKPHPESPTVRTLFRDNIVPIHGIVAASQPVHNPIWYRIETEGYLHSGSAQPVSTRLYPPVIAIPAGGLLGEVSVPFTDVYPSPDKTQPPLHRLYYQTVHRILDRQTDPNGQVWYLLLEDKWQKNWYVLAEHLRPIPLEELSPLAPHVPHNAKHIEVYLAEQRVVAYEWQKPVFTARAATGAVFSNGDFTTPTGEFRIFHKRPTRHMAAGDLASNGYDLPGVPWVCYITESGIAFHGTYWHNDYGKPRSHGCINLTPHAARFIYRWTLPQVPPQDAYIYAQKEGTRVLIYPSLNPSQS